MKDAGVSALLAAFLATIGGTVANSFLMAPKTEAQVKSLEDKAKEQLEMYAQTTKSYAAAIDKLADKLERQAEITQQNNAQTQVLSTQVTTLTASIARVEEIANTKVRSIQGSLDATARDVESLKRDIYILRERNK